MTEEFELHIDSIAAGGDGVGRRNGLVAFVPRTAPGDMVVVRAEQRDRLLRGSIIRMISPSALRVEPPCAHYVVDRCGGCQVQHLSYDAQLDAKAGIIRDAITRIGRIAVDRPPVEPSDAPWRYRRKLTLALRRRSARWVAGLHRFDAPDDVFELRDCPITDEGVLAAWQSVMERQDFFPSARELRGAVRLLSSGFSFALEGGREWTAAPKLFTSISGMQELWWTPDGQRRRLIQSRTAGTQAGASFTQVNPGVAGKLRDWVVSIATAIRPRTAVDAYAGTGDVAVALAANGIRVVAIEIDRDAARVCEARLPQGSRAVAGAVERALPDALPADLVILNPPRAGVHARVADLLDAGPHRPARVVYVSCNPATLARDLRRMTSYRVVSLRGFDMFPQTAHVETVCELVPAA